MCFVDTSMCPAWDLNPEPTNYVPLRLPPPHRARLWSGLSLHHASKRCRRRPSSLYTFPEGLGSGLTYRRVSGLAFPEFERMFTVRFPVQAPIESQQLYHLSYGGIV